MRIVADRIFEKRGNTMGMDKKAGPYILISYSHKDGDIVREDVENLRARGVRVWIDHRTETIENMSLSDNWYQKVEEAVKHPNCRAVIFYVSVPFLLSKSIQREQRLVRELCEKKCQDAEAKDFCYYCVSVNGKPMSDHLFEAAMESRNPASPYFDKNYYGKEPEKMQREMFDDDKLVILRENSDECVRMIYSKIAGHLGASDDVSATMEALEKISLASRDTGDIPFGIYKEGEPCDPVARPKGNTRFEVNGKQYIHHNGEVFATGPLQWKLMYVQDARAVLLCSKVLEKGPFTEVQDYLQIFEKLAFSAAEASIIEKIRLMNPQDVEWTEPVRRDAVLALDASQERMYWWIDQEGILPEWRRTYQNNKPVNNGFLVTRPKGFRPVIEVCVDDLKGIKGGA